MSKRRVSSSERRPRRSSGSLGTSAFKAPSPSKSEQKFIRFLGLSLSGGKSDKSCLAVVDFYETSQRLFLNRIFDRVRAEEFISADHKLHELIQQFSENCRWLMMDVPLSFPVCLDCDLVCPGYETCGEPQLKWMRSVYQETDKRKPKKMFTPYTQRSVDLWLQENSEEGIDVQHAMGANLAPLVARAHFIRRRLALECLEVFPKLAVYRLGLELKVNKSHLKSYRNSVGGEEARRAFLQAMSDKMGVFFYVHDLKLMIENFHAFDAFICAFVGYLKQQGQTLDRPLGFPRTEAWVEIPK